MKEEINIIEQLSNLKEVDYRNTLAIATVIELLIDKGVFTREEFKAMSAKLDNMSEEDIKKLK